MFIMFILFINNINNNNIKKYINNIKNKVEKRGTLLSYFSAKITSGAIQ